MLSSRSLLQTVFQSRHIVTDFAQVFRAAFWNSTRLGGQQFAQRRLCAFDPAGVNGFPPDEGPDEQVRVGKLSPFSRQPPEQAISLGQDSDQPGRPDSFRRQRMGRPGRWGQPVARCTTTDSATRNSESSGSQQPTQDSC